MAGYGLTFAVFLGASGRIGDRIGRRRALSVGLGLFVVTSGLWGLAPSAAVLFGARFGQGIAAAMFSPDVLSLLGVVYTGSKRVRAITAYGILMGLAAVGGQVVGGLLIAADVGGSGWRAIFVINVPIGVIALALVPRIVPESRAEHARRVEAFGMALVTLALIALVLPLIEGNALGWPAWRWASFSASAVCPVSFVVHQRRLAVRGGAPLLDPGLIRSATLRSGLSTQLTFWCSQASFFLVLSLYLQDGRGLDPLDADLVFTILAASCLVVSLRAPALTARFGRDPVLVGAFLVAGGNGALGDGCSKAFGRTLVELAALLVGVTLLTHLLPGRGVCPEALGA